MRILKNVGSCLLHWCVKSTVQFTSHLCLSVHCTSALPVCKGCPLGAHRLVQETNCNPTMMYYDGFWERERLVFTEENGDLFYLMVRRHLKKGG